jgi:hypothetical protein
MHKLLKIKIVQYKILFISFASIQTKLTNTNGYYILIMNKI